MPNRTASDTPAVLAYGVGAFTQSVMRCLKQDGANVFGYLTRPYAHFGPTREGVCFYPDESPDPIVVVRTHRIALIVPMSIEWALKPWTQRLIDEGVPILCATGEALKLERERDFARRLCGEAGIPFPKARSVQTTEEAKALVRETGHPWVIKNPLCSPTSPIHTIVCESSDDTLAWLDRVDDSEGVFLQEYLGRREAGHIALVSDGEIHSLVTNQEYKRAFTGNLGLVAGAPLGGLVERDPDDRYGLASELLQPLLPWFRQVKFKGPVQVTAILHDGRWHVLEYNVRLGVTSGPMILRMLANPLETLLACGRNEPLAPRWRPACDFGCSLTLAGHGYPYTQVTGPRVPIRVEGEPTCDLWWQEVAARVDGTMEATGHRLVDVAAISDSLDGAITVAYENIRRIRCLGSYYRTDIGRSLWPPGEE